MHDYAALTSASKMTSTVFRGSGRRSYLEKTLSRHRTRRRAASASAKDGVRLAEYQGSDGQDGFVPWVVMYQHQIEL